MLAACSSPASETAREPDKTATQTATEPVAKPLPPKPRVRVENPLVLAPDGLLLADHDGKMQLLPYGTERDKAESAVGVVLAPPTKRGSSSECGAGTVDYTDFRNGLQMTFQEGKFTGWTINAARSPFKTTKGIGIGSTRQELHAAYKDLTVEDSSLGLLFSSGDLTGLLDIDGIEGLVTDLWAGTVCLID
ncbi:hypothetical protein BWQ93_19945 [Sphingopyxis sp. QXT-31]|nr:hypothetical protein BWQ93_19945 [Sphingopyxis sp. QXT-31]